MFTVSELAKLAGVTVRTLHHYDKIGLLKPTKRSDSGYRLYDQDDLRKLQQIMFWRALRLELSKIKTLLNDPAFDRVQMLEQQRAELKSEADRLQHIIAAVDDALAESRGEKSMNELELFAFNHTEHHDEAKSRWGNTDAWAQSESRRTSWNDDQKSLIAKTQLEHTEKLAEAMAGGLASNSPEAMDLAEEARVFIHENFYECSHEMHSQLAEMYVEDARFAAHYNRHVDGLAEWYRNAIFANEAREEIENV